MKDIIKFKNNVFKKTSTSPFGPNYELGNSKEQLLKFKHDLEKIKHNFKDYDSREVILTHKTALPPKTKRCVLEILAIHKSITHSTNRFTNYDNENIKLEVMLNFKNKYMNFYIDNISTLIALIDTIHKENNLVSILKDKIDNYPHWLKIFIEKNNLKKNKIIPLIYVIQNYYEKISLPKAFTPLDGELIISFSSASTKKEYLEKNKNIDYKNINNETLENNKILINSQELKDLTNIVSIHKNQKIRLVKSEIILETNNFFNLEPIAKGVNTIGVLDSMIPQDTPFRSVIKVTSFLNNKETIHHGEGIASIIFAGDRLNNFYDGCGPFNVHHFEVYEKDMGCMELVNRIELAISTNQKIKVWNLSINVPSEEAFAGGEITWLGSEIDRIQEKYNVIVVQSAGNKNDFASQNILAPGDAIKSIVVNATQNLGAQEPAPYALTGHNKFFTQKPDVAFFGGSKQDPVKILKNGKIIENFGTSFATPFIARKIAHLIYYENKGILEAKALLIHAAYVNSHLYVNENNGWGVVPQDIHDVLNTNDHSIRFVFNEEIHDTRAAFMNLNIPQSDMQDYSIFMTAVCWENLDKKYGCEYVRSAVNVNMGPLDTNKKIISYRKLKPHFAKTSHGEALAIEAQLIKFYGKWKPNSSAKDVILKDRRGNNLNFKNYGIIAKIDKRMNVITKNIPHDLICVVTLVHKDKLDKYNEFIIINENNVEITSSIELIGNIKLDI